MPIKPRINTPVDRFNFLFHAGLQAGAFAAVCAFVSSPIILVSSLGISFAVSYFMTDKGAKFLRENIPAATEETLPRGSKHLVTLVKILAKTLDLNEVPHLQLLQKQGTLKKRKRFKSGIRYKDKDDKPSQDEAAGALAEMMGKSANAAAYGTSIKDYGIFITQPLLETLNADQETGVIAHEMAHIAAKHARKQRLLNLFSNAATFAAGAFLFNSYFSAGSAGIALLAGGYVVADVVKSALSGIYGDEISDVAKSRIASAGKLVSQIAVVGASFYFGMPQVGIALMVSRGVTLGTEITNDSFERRNEFQADRISAEATRMPLALCSGLKKTYEYNVQADPENFAALDYHEGSPVARVFKMAATVFSSHPNVGRRCTRLDRIDRRLHPKLPANAL